MTNRRIIMAIVMMGVCLLAFALSYLLLKDTKLATVVYVGILGITIFFVEPYVGLVNYLLFLYVRPHEYIAALTGVPVMLGIAAATAGLMIVHMIVSPMHRYFARSPQNYFVIWFLAAITMSHLSMLFLPSAVDATMDFLPIVLMYFLVANLVNTEGKLRFTVYFLVTLTIILATSAIVQFYTGTGLGGAEAYKGTRVQGIGIFSDPNDLALALIIFLPFLFFKLIENRGTVIGKIFLFLTIGVLTYGIVLTESRGGILAYALLAMLLFSRRFGWVIGGMAGGLAMVAAMLASSRMGTISTEEGSAAGRIAAWGLGLDLFELRPIFGFGAGQFTEYHFRTAHNSFVLAASELGMFGFYPWMMLMYVSYRNMTFVAREAHLSKMREAGIYAEALRYAIIAFAAAAFWLSRTYSELLFILVALCAALTHMFVRSTGLKFKLIEKRDFVRGFFLSVGMLVFIKIFLYWAW